MCPCVQLLVKIEQVFPLYLATWRRGPPVIQLESTAGAYDQYVEICYTITRTVKREWLGKERWRELMNPSTEYGQEKMEGADAALNKTWPGKKKWTELIKALSRA